jgi:uncharacterized membrane protein
MTTATTAIQDPNTTERRLNNAERAARGLGWFSIGLGLAQITAPRRVARMIGVDDDEANRDTLLAIGVRELASGVGILTRERPIGPVWTRVGGDVMDLALLGRALRRDDGHRNRLTAATAAVVGLTILDILAGHSLARESGTRPAARRPRGIRVRKAITIDRPRDEVYRFWRNLENLPRFMQHLERVRVLDARRSRWTARAPAGASVEWTAELIDDQPNELIVWRSVDGATIPNTGSVQFTPASHGGTAVLVELRYQPPGGRLAAIVAKLFGDEPDIQVGSDLRRLKQVLELGEVVHSDATVLGTPHPARPARWTDVRITAGGVS